MGRRASQPDATWRPPQRLATETDGTRLRFIEEQSGRTTTFDLSSWPVTAGIREWLARALQRRFGARSAVKRTRSAAHVHYYAGAFAASLGRTPSAPNSPTELTASHLRQYLHQFDGNTAQHDHLKYLKSLLADDPELPEQARTALLDFRCGTRRTGALRAYSDTEWNMIMTAARHDIRLARNRIQCGRAILAAHRGGTATGVDARAGQLLDQLDRIGVLPRQRNGNHGHAVQSAGGSKRLIEALSLRQWELTAFCLLLVGMTGQNFGTVSTWPAVHYRPDGTGGEDGIGLLEATKPRRGPAREHMITALEDLPAGLAEVFGETDSDRRLFRSPLRVYLLLVDLTQMTRRHSGHDSAFTCYHASGGGGHWAAGVASSHVKQWAQMHGFPTRTQSDPTDKPAINVARIRQTVIERQRRPIAHSRATMNDIYLHSSATVTSESRIVVGAALREQVDQARTHQHIPVFTADFIAAARADPAAAASQAGLGAEVLTELLDGRHDTVVAGCVDHLTGPHTEPGLPCTASFLTCLECVNARALPHHMPIQIAVRDHIAALRPHLDPRVWAARYEQPMDRLDDILGHYTTAQIAAARTALTPAQQRLVEDLLTGRLDLR